MRTDSSLATLPIGRTFAVPSEDRLRRARERLRKSREGRPAVVLVMTTAGIPAGAGITAEHRAAMEGTLPQLLSLVGLLGRPAPRP